MSGTAPTDQEMERGAETAPSEAASDAETGPTTEAPATQRATGVGGLTRRRFLHRGGAFATAATLPAGRARADSSADDCECDETEAGDGSAGGPTVRRFTVYAVDVDIVYNRYGQHQPQGAMYVLEENLDAVRAASGEVLGDAWEAFPADGGEHPEDQDDDEAVDTSVIQPLVLRANRGDIVEVEFVNRLDRHASIHQTALPYDVDTSDGMSVGYNPDSTVPPGGSTTYRWYADHEGTHYFRDGVSQAFDSTPHGNPEKVNNLARGLFGAVVVEPEGATWTDPKTGGELRSGVRADVHDPTRLGTSYREFVVFYHDPGEITNADGSDPTHPHADSPQHVHGLNYRGDQTGARLGGSGGSDCVDCGEKVGFYSSWIHGDPGGGDSVYEVYQGDPVKLVAVGANLEENHSHHIHNHRWKEIPGRTDSDTIDAQTVGPGATYETYFTVGHGAGEVDTAHPEMDFREAFEVGAGGEHGTVGDVLFHCHLFPHYAEGMNAAVRIHDKEQADLLPLPTNDLKLAADSDVPGFPEFVPGEYGRLQPEPPVPGVRDPTLEERAALGDDIVPGAPYADPCIGCQVEREIEYTVVALPATIVYNDAGDHDPDGQVFVLEEDAEAVRNGEVNPEPLVIRANVGDCISLTLKNETDSAKSLHPHFVRYDLQGSDGMDMGYNYDGVVEPGEEQQHRWFADEEGTVFFHGHATALLEGMHGVFATIVVESKGSRWLDPHSGEPIRSGTQAIIERPDGESFREATFIYHDFAPLVDRNGEFVEEHEQHGQNAGVMAVNYRNAPYYRRRGADPAYLHSSFVHGDPPTPVLETYAGEPVRIRLVHGPWEEQHNFHVHGLEVDTFQLDPTDATCQVTNVSEAFTFHLDERPDFEKLPNPAGLPVRDYLYGSMIADDIWNGMWGLCRVWDGRVDHLRPLSDCDAPERRITEAELREMGHPAVHSEHDWTELGQVAKRLYGPDADRDYPADKDARQNVCLARSPPPAAPGPGDPHAGEAPVRRYDVTALQVPIPYNDYGDHDPHGIAFVPDEHVEDVLAGRRHPEPLTLRAAEGECVEVRLTNALPEAFDADHPDPEMRAERPWTPSSRISLHPTRVTYDVNGSDGATVGFNYDGTVAPGESTTYRWFADEQTDGCVLWDMADLRGHRHHGAFGQLVVEPADSTWLDPQTAEPIETGAQAMVKDPNGADFREFSLAFSDGMYVVNREDVDDAVVPKNADDHEQDESSPSTQVGDPEDQGYVGVNNRAEPFARRFEHDDAQHRVFSSRVHGDPATPVVNALLDDPVAFRVCQTADKPRGLTFHLANHEWERFRGVEDGPIAAPRIGVEDDYSPGKAHTVEPFGGAGGLRNQTGDFVYQAMKLRRRLEAGWWGIFRVRDDLDGFAEPVQPLPDRAGGIAPWDRPGWVVATGDLAGNGAEDLVVLVPDSARGDAAAYLFLGPVDPRSVTDLTGADVSAVLHREADCHRVDVTVAERCPVGAAALLGSLRDATLAVRNCGCLGEHVPPLDLATVDWSAVDVRVTDETTDRPRPVDAGVECVAVDGDDVTVTLRDGTDVVVRGAGRLVEE